MAGTIPAGSMSTEVKLNGSQSVKTLKELKQAVQEASSAWKAQRAELASVGKSTEAAESKYKGLAESVKKQKDYISGLRIAQKHLQEAQKSVDRSTQEGQREYGKYNEALQKNETRIHSAESKLSSLTSQQTKAKKSLDYYKSGLADVQKQLRSSTAVTRSYVDRLQAEGKGYEASRAKLNGYKNSISNLTRQQKIQEQELSRIASESGKTSDAYKRQQIRVNETATSLAKAKTQMNDLDNSMKKANPSFLDRIKSKLSNVNTEANKTHRTFKEVFMGSALGNALSNSLSNIGSGLQNAYKQGMNLNEAVAKINGRFKGMNLGNRAISSLDKQISHLKENTNMTGENVADLQSKMLNWSTIGRKGAMQMTKMIAGVGDSSKLSGDEIARMGAGLMRVGSTGKVTYSSLSRITRSAPTFYAQLAKGAGMSESHLKSLLRSGNVTQKQFQQWMAAAAKYSDTAFKGFGKTQGGAIKYMQERWHDLEKDMTAPIFNAKTSGLQALKDLMASPEITNGAKAIGKAISGVISYLDKHKKDISGVVKDTMSIAGAIGKAVWKDFGAIVGDIGKSFGLIHGNSSKSVSPLHAVREAMDGLAKNRTAITVIARAIELMAVAKLASTADGLLHISTIAKGSLGAIVGLSKGFKGIENPEQLKGVQKAFYKMGGFIKAPKSKLKDLSQSFQSAFKSISKGAGQTGHVLKSLFDQSDKSAGKLSGLLESMHHAKGFGGLSRAGQVATVAAGAGVAVSTASSIVKAIRDKAGSRKQYQDIGKSAGTAIGGGIGLWFFGPAGAAIGAKIGATVGKWAGNAAKDFTKGWDKNKPPKNKFSVENFGWSAHNMAKQMGKWGSNVAKNFSQGISRGQSNIKKALNRSSKSMHSAAKGWSKWSNQVGKNTQKAFSKAGSATRKGVKAIYNHLSTGNKQIVKSVGAFGKRYVKTHQKYTRATEKNFAGFSKRLKRNHGNLFTTIGQTAKRQLKIEQTRWRSNWNNISKTAKGIWHGMQTNNHNMYLNFNRWTHGGLGKVMSGFRSFGRTLSSFWTRLMNNIGRFFRKTFAGIGHTIHNVQSAIGKLMGGKVKVGNMHLANGTDWRKKYPIPAIVNDGTDSPSTNNREGLIDADGSVYPYPNARNLRTILWPGQNVINAHDMAAMFGNAFHFAAGTVSRARNLPEINKRGGSGTIQGMSKLLKQLIKDLKTVRKLAKVTLKIKGEKTVSKLSRDIKSAAKGSNALAKATRRVGTEIRSAYSSVKRHNFASLITKEVKKATTASSKDMNKFVKDFDKDQRKMVSNSNKNTKKLVKDFDTQWKKVLKNATSDYKKWVSSTEHLQSQFNNRFKKGWHSLDNATSSIFKKFWSSMHTTARKGMNAVLAVLNGGISRIDSVVREFGGSGHAIHRVSHLATGTGYFSGQRRAITKPTLAILNDGNDSPETGNRETLWNPTSGDLYAVHGRNVPMIIPPKWEVFNGRESRELGFSHFASGTGALHHLYELAKHYWGKPIQTGKSMFNAVRGLTGAINKIAQGMRKSGMGQGIDWWSQLWKMVEDKVNDDGGPASGLLKAVEKYGEGHRYVWGAAGPTTFDCSGLVMYALKHAYGISYPHFSGAQYGMTQHISKSQAKMGDLVFWGSGGSDHVGVYAGGNRYFSAQSPSQGIHMNTLDSVVGKGRPLFGRVRGVNTHGNKGLKIKAKNSLQKLIRAQVGKGFWRTIQKIADKYGTDGQFGNPAGDGVMRWKGLVKKALRANGFSASPYQVSAWLRVIARESNGNPHAVNNWDINAREGHPSKGLVQTIPGVFAAFHHKGHNNIFNGYDDLLAGINYMAHKYGRGPRAFALVSNPKIGYANGGIANTPSIFGESGPEMAIPLIPTKSTRAWELIGKAIGILSKGNGNQVSLQQVQKEQKQEQERWAMLFNFLTDLVGEMADTTIKTDVKIDGRTAWSALSKYARQEFKRMAVSQRKGYAHGI